MNARIFIGDTQVDAVPANDRGLAYGDGVFETMRVDAGALPLWARHRARLIEGARQSNTPANGAGLCSRRRWNNAAGSNGASKSTCQPRDRLTWKTSPAAK